MFGKPMPTALTALQSAALETSLALRECGELDENMYPSAASAAAALGKSSAYHADTGLPNFGSTKRRQYYYKQAAKYLTTAPSRSNKARAKDCRSVKDPDGVKQDDISEAVENESADKRTRYRLYALDLRLSCPIPDDQGCQFDWK